jgi:hypothetical protein
MIDDSVTEYIESFVSFMMMVLLWRSSWCWLIFYVIIMTLAVVVSTTTGYQPTTYMHLTIAIRTNTNMIHWGIRKSTETSGVEYDMPPSPLQEIPSLSTVSLLPLSSRRRLFQQIMIGIRIGIMVTSTSNICHAEEDETFSISSTHRITNDGDDKKNLSKDETTERFTTTPYAISVRALIPAVRVRNMIDQSIQITKQIMTLQQQQESLRHSNQINKTTTATEGRNQEIMSLVEQLQQLLLQPQNFTALRAENDDKDSDAIVVVGSKTNGITKFYRDRYNENRAPLSIWAQPGAVIVQQGEIATWKRLQQQEESLAQKDEIRAAFNTYMNQIQYSTTQYTLTVPQEERKQMIRTETLPDLLRQVVPSDMDLRTLYRNMVLTSIQDARAELRYQMAQAMAASSSTTSSSWDGQELLHLLVQAQEATNDWFKMIDPDEIRRAEQQEQADQQQQQHN